jgi:aminoglycoside phosphotransferase family enzyme
MTMSHICTICTDDEAHSINVALVHRDAYRHTASRYEVSTGALQRHAREHLPELLMRARDAVEVAEADSLLDRVESFYKRTEAILEAAESNSEWGTALQAIKECRGTWSFWVG